MREMNTVIRMNIKSKTGIAAMVFALASIWSVPSMAQTTPEESRAIVHRDVDPRMELREEENLWLDSRNPSAISMKVMPNMGITQFVGEHIGGDLHRQMETDARNSWGFGANSYQSLKHINLWGDFAFSEKHHMGRGWSDNFSPYNGNPYQVGSNLRGDYTEQVFDFGVKAASNRVWRRWWFGLGLDYSIGDLSRIQDPRSRVQMVDLTLTPGFVVEVAKNHRLGAHFAYRYRKEKNNAYVSKAQDSKEYELYMQEGLGVYRKIVSSSFDRRTKGNSCGGGLEYTFSKEKFQILTRVDFMKRSDEIEDRQKASPGDYSDKTLGIGVHAQWLRPQARHTASVNCRLLKGEAQKTFQEVISETDPTSGITTSHYQTMFSSKSFTHDRLKIDARWRYTRLRAEDYAWFIGAMTSMERMKDKYVFYTPASMMDVSSLRLGVEGGGNVLRHKRHRLFIEGEVGYSLNMDDKYAISPDLEDQVIRAYVCDADFRIYSSNILDMGLRLKYIFPLFKKLDGFASLDGRYLISTTDTRFKRGIASLSLGILRRF